MKRSRQRARGRVAILVLPALLAGCGSTPTLRPPTATVSPRASPPLIQPVRVAVIVMENHSYDSVIGLPYISTLASTATVLNDYHFSGHPSVPNYLALTSGQTWGISDDGYYVLPMQDIGDQLTTSGLPWRAYMEGMGTDCMQTSGEYTPRHDPFAYYGGRCPPSVVPFSQLSGDLAGASPPRFIWITPNLCNDMHDCSAAVGDAWLQHTVPQLLASPAMSNGVVFITWDENDGGDSTRVLTLVLGSKRPVSPDNTYSHPALLATVEDLLGLPRLAATQGLPAIALR